jgi:predicted GNAT family N-acyltransferase
MRIVRRTDEQARCSAGPGQRLHERGDQILCERIFAEVTAFALNILGPVVAMQAAIRDTRAKRGLIKKAIEICGRRLTNDRVRQLAGG